MPTLTRFDERLSVPVERVTADALRAIARAEGEGLAVILRRAIRLLLAEVGRENV